MNSTEVKTFHKPVGFIHTVGTDEAGSGIVNFQVINPPTDQTDDLLSVFNVFSSINVDKTTGFKSTYNTVSGILKIENGTTNFAVGDIVNVIGMFV